MLHTYGIEVGSDIYLTVTTQSVVQKKITIGHKKGQMGNLYDYVEENDPVEQRYNTSALIRAFS